MLGMSPAPTTVLLHRHPAGVVFSVLLCRIIALFALSTFERNDDTIRFPGHFYILREGLSTSAPPKPPTLFDDLSDDPGADSATTLANGEM